MKIVSSKQLDEAVKLLKKGEVVAFPTETVYGLGVIFDNKEAYDKLVAVKKRPSQKPFTLMLADVEDVEKYAELNDVSRVLVKNFMPGQFTMITTAKPGLPSWCVSEIGRVGIRIADYDLIRNLIRKVGKPLLVPSANRSGEEPATTAKQVAETFGDEFPLVIDGKTVSNTPSTVVMVEDTYTHVFREGAVKIEDIKKVISEEK